jgi:hypothetical protein
MGKRAVNEFALVKSGFFELAINKLAVLKIKLFLYLVVEIKGNE